MKKITNCLAVGGDPVMLDGKCVGFVNQEHKLAIFGDEKERGQVMKQAQKLKFYFNDKPVLQANEQQSKSNPSIYEEQ